MFNQIKMRKILKGNCEGCDYREYRAFQSSQGMLRQITAEVPIFNHGKVSIPLGCTGRNHPIRVLELEKSKIYIIFADDDAYRVRVAEGGLSQERLYYERDVERDGNLIIQQASYTLSRYIIRKRSLRAYPDQDHGQEAHERELDCVENLLDRQLRNLIHEEPLCCEQAREWCSFQKSYKNLECRYTEDELGEIFELDQNELKQIRTQRTRDSNGFDSSGGGSSGYQPRPESEGEAVLQLSVEEKFEEEFPALESAERNTRRKRKRKKKVGCESEGSSGSEPPIKKLRAELVWHYQPSSEALFFEDDPYSHAQAVEELKNTLSRPAL